MNASQLRHFAIIPGAGESRRMGSAKLLLPWRGRTILDWVLKAWCDSEVSEVVLVLRESTSEFNSVIEHWPVTAVYPSFPPPDMKSSVQFALNHIQELFAPRDTDRWLLAPADLPTLGEVPMDVILKQGAQSNEILIPRFSGESGHPVSLPWRLASDVFSLGDDEGVKALVSRHPHQFVDFPDVRKPRDIDTPRDYDRLCSSD